MHAKFAKTSSYGSSWRLTPSTSSFKNYLDDSIFLLAGNVLQKGTLNMACVHKRVLKQ